jgi:hypothetical protein
MKIETNRKIVVESDDLWHIGMLACGVAVMVSVYNRISLATVGIGLAYGEAMHYLLVKPYDMPNIGSLTFNTGPAILASLESGDKKIGKVIDIKHKPVDVEIEKTEEE